MSTSTYTPRNDSTVGRVVAFFRDNADEELSMEDIVTKFGVSRSAVHTMLAQAVSTGLLARSQDSGDWIYRAAAGLPKLHAPPRSSLIDPLTVKLEDGVPPPLGRGHQRRGWPVLLSKMQPGQSCVLPNANRAAVSQAALNLGKQTGAKFIRRATEDGENFRIWRTE